MSQMKRVVLPVLEEVAAKEGTQKEVYNRMYTKEDMPYRGFGRIWRLLIAQGAIEAVKPSLFAYRNTAHRITEEGKEWIGDE